MQFPTCSANLCRISMVNQNPNYLEARLKNLNSFSKNRGILFLILDSDDLNLLELINIKSFEYNCLLLVASSLLDLIEFIKGFVSKPKPNTTYKEPGEFLGQIKGVNKSDVSKLFSR